MSAPRCVCARHEDGSVTTMLCPAHADRDPCLTMATVTGKRRKGTIRRGVCTACGWAEASCAHRWDFVAPRRDFFTGRPLDEPGFAICRQCGEFGK